MNRKKLVWFKVFALLVPVVILCLSEFALRLCNYGYTTALFVQDPDDKTCLVMNPDASARYFSNPVNATKGNHERFKAVKTAGTFRIFVLGESTTAGYPYMHNGSFHRWLQYRLMHTFPDRNFEVVNVSLTAVNSYTVKDFGKQVILYQPDAVLIYTGHNEYYGALGIGSTSRIAGNHVWIGTVLMLRQYRLVQLLENGIRHFNELYRNKQTDTRDNLMKRMASSQEISYGSADYHKGTEQFDRNMNELCRLLSSQHIPVFLSTLVSNEKDLKPFISTKDKHAADSCYGIGSAAYAKGDFKTSKAAYVKASEFDLLRFRAPQAMNVSIRKIASRYPGIYLTDSRSLFEKYSPHDILGKETLLEHVHPNLLGYALMSEAFYQEMKKSRVINPAVGAEISFPALLKQMPVTKVDSLCGAYQIMMLKTGWPFNEPISRDFKQGVGIEEKIAGALAVNRISWTDAMDQLFKYSMKNNDKLTALKATEAVMLENPYVASYTVYAGRLSFETGNFNQALLYFKKAFSLDPSHTNLESLYLLCLKIDRPKDALIYLEKLRGVNSQVAAIDQATALLKDIIRLKDGSIPLPDSSKKLIAIDYQRLNAEETAARYK